MTLLQKLLNVFRGKMEKKYVTGIDIYHGDIITDWELLSKNIDFIFLKCTEGDFRNDPKFGEYRYQAHEHGIICGFYHFYRSNKDPIAQAQKFCSSIGSLHANELPPVCDWETEDDPKDGNDVTEIRVYLDSVEQYSGMKPIIYTGSSFAQDKNLTKEFSDYPLWVAHYTKNSPKIPKPWLKWTFWQSTDKAVVPGMKNKCDFNYFNGSLDELKSLCKKG